MGFNCADMTCWFVAVPQLTIVVECEYIPTTYDDNLLKFCFKILHVREGHRMCFKKQIWCLSCLPPKNNIENKPLYFFLWIGDYIILY